MAIRCDLAHESGGKHTLTARLTPAGGDVPTLDPPAWFPSSDEVVFATGTTPTRRIVARRIDGAGASSR
jgi:hypothetical protein